MAVVLQSGMKRFIGKSTDSKPTAGQLDASSGLILTATDVPPGAEFYETDTGLTYRFDGTTWWPEGEELGAQAAAAKLTDLAPYAGLLILLPAVLIELRAIRTLLANAYGAPSFFEPLPVLKSDPTIQ